MWLKSPWKDSHLVHLRMWEKGIAISRFMNIFVAVEKAKYKMNDYSPINFLESKEGICRLIIGSEHTSKKTLHYSPSIRSP